MISFQRYPVLFIFFLLGSNLISLQGQTENSDYNLLWEISGNGLKQPSYLLGSMHSEDKSIFSFPDSLWVALENCKAFANEVHLDSAMNRYLAYLLDSDDFLNRPKKKKPAKSDNPEIQIEPPFSNKKEEKIMPTMLDAYLMHIAKGKGKKIFGLESIDDNFEMMKNSSRDLGFSQFFKTTPEYQRLLSIYRSGSLKKIEDYVNQNEKTFQEDILLNERNLVQAQSIGRLAQQYSLFSVVGAAHLGGEKGVIQLLKNQGYQLRAVNATFTKAPYSDSLYTAITQPWFHKTNGKNSYVVQMPQPAQKMFVSEFLTMYFSMDIGTGTYYYIFETINNLSEDDSPEVQADSIIQRLVDIGYTISSKDTLTFQNTPGLEISFYNPYEEIKHNKARILIREHTVVFLQMGALSKAMLDSPIADHFFQSLNLLEPSSVLVDTLNKDGAFSVLLPENSEYREQTTRVESGDDYVMKIYQGTIEDNFFLLRFNDFPKGLYLESDSILLNSLKELLSIKYNMAPVSEEIINFEGYPGIHFRFNVEGLSAECRVFIRGHRNYVLMFVGKANSDLSETFFNSFQFLPFRQPALYKMYAIDSTLQIRLPIDSLMSSVQSELTYISDTKKEYLIAATDRSTGALFMVEAFEYSPFYQEYQPSHVDSALQAIPPRLINGEDLTLDSSRLVNLGEGLRAIDFVVSQKVVNTKIRYLAFYRNNYFYLFYAYLPFEMVENPTVNAFFSEIEFSEALQEELSLFYPKSQMILDSLFANDSTTMKEARIALADHKFTGDYFPAIYQLLEDQSPQALDEETKTDLTKQFRYTQDTSATAFMKRYYQPSLHLDLRHSILNNLLYTKSQESIAAFFEWAQSDTAAISGDVYFPLVSTLGDSLELFREFYPQLKQLSQQGFFEAELFLLAETTWKDSTFDPSFLQKDLDFFHQLAATELEFKEENDPFLRSTIIDFYQILAPDEKRIAQVRTLVENTNKSKWIKLEGLKYLATQKQRIELGWIQPLLEDSIYHYDALKFLYDHGLQKMTDKKYYKQEYLAKVMFESEVYEYEDYFPKAELVGSQKVDYKGSPQKVYIFKYYFPEWQTEPDETINWYFGIAGPFPLQSKDKTFSDALVNWSYEIYDPKRSEEMTLELVNQLLD